MEARSRENEERRRALTLSLHLDDADAADVLSHAKSVRPQHRHGAVSKLTTCIQRPCRTLFLCAIFNQVAQESCLSFLDFHFLQRRNLAPTSKLHQFVKDSLRRVGGVSPRWPMLQVEVEEESVQLEEAEDEGHVELVLRCLALMCDGQNKVLQVRTTGNRCRFVHSSTRESRSAHPLVPQDLDAWCCRTTCASSRRT